MLIGLFMMKIEYCPCNILHFYGVIIELHDETKT
jgi:hypothetical protein